MSKEILTHEYLKSILHYSIITGQFFYLRATAQCVKIGALAGTLSTNGYNYIKINGTRYSAHRLAWFWVMGEWPANQIDHKNGVRDANWWLNMREATCSQNCCNTKKHIDNTSGYKGVFWEKRSQRWRASITLNRKSKHLGYYATSELAYAARIKAEQSMHGDFSRAVINQ